MTFYGPSRALLLPQWFLCRSRSDMPTDVFQDHQVRISRSRGQNDPRLLRVSSEAPHLIHVARHATKNAGVLVLDANLECLHYRLHGVIVAQQCGVCNPFLWHR